MNKGVKTGPGPKGHLVVVEQGQDSFTVTLTEVLRYQHSFLAGYFRNLDTPSSVDDHKTTFIKVEERKVEYFPFIEQYYANDKLKLEPSVDKKALLAELEFWFTTSELNVTYKDPIAELEFLRREAIRKAIKDQEIFIVQSISARATSGHSHCTFSRQSPLPRISSMLHAPAFQEIYTEVLKELFPTDNITINVHAISIIAKWHFFEGALGKIACKVLIEKCKALWKRLYNASVADCISGITSVELGECADYFVENDKEFIHYFKKYVQKKSPQMTAPTFQLRNGTPVVELKWGIRMNTPPPPPLPPHPPHLSNTHITVTVPNIAHHDNNNNNINKRRRIIHHLSQQNG